MRRFRRNWWQRVWSSACVVSLAATGYPAGVLKAQDEPAVDIGNRLEPLVDDYLLERMSGSVRLCVQKPEPQEVVLTADAPWEGNTSAYFTIFQDGTRFRMYYRGSHVDEKTQRTAHREVTCYAESSDGIHWTKPKLGLYEFDGSRDNNIVWDGPGTHCFTPFLDTNPHARPEARYKALTAISGGLMALQSADGIHWLPMRGQPVITQGNFDSQNLAFWDTHLGQYREYHRAFHQVRDIMTSTSRDFLQWSQPQFLTYRQTRVEHLYTNAVMPYPGAPHILIGFPTRFLPNTQQTEPTFMVSRDGKQFLRYEEAIIPLTAPADRDGNRCNYMAWGLLQLPGDHVWSVYATEAYYKGTGTRVRRFTYRPDGLVALVADSSGGEVITRPLRFTGQRLIVNFRTRSQGTLKIELQDTVGMAIPKFTAAACHPLQGDELDATVRWQDQPQVDTLVGQPIRMRFILRDAELFSFRFE